MQDLYHQPSHHVCNRSEAADFLKSSGHLRYCLFREWSRILRLIRTWFEMDGARENTAPSAFSTQRLPGGVFEARDEFWSVSWSMAEHLRHFLFTCRLEIRFVYTDQSSGVCAQPEPQGLDQQDLWKKGPKPYFCSYLANFVCCCLVLAWFVILCSLFVLFWLYSLLK